MPNKFIKPIITLVILGCFVTLSVADEILLKDNYPERHVVVKGDTLWGISGKFLKDPWQWPKVWRMNKAEIKNPHRIYPGDVIYLDTSGRNPQLRIAHQTVVLKPGIVIEELEAAAIPTISPSVIAPFLSQPLIIEKDQLEGAPSIIAGQDNRVALSPGVRIYVEGIPETNKKHWNIYRQGKTLTDPDTKEVLGVEAIYLGDAQITKAGKPATGQVVRAKEEIFVGDKLVEAVDNIPTSFVPHAPDFQVHGRILSAYGGVAEVGPNAVVTINKGFKDGLEQGHVLTVNRFGRTIKNPEIAKRARLKQIEDNKNGKPKLKELNFDTKKGEDGKWEVNFPKEKEGESLKDIKLPDERVGLVMIFRTFERVSYGIIVEATEPVNVLDAVETPN